MPTACDLWTGKVNKVTGYGYFYVKSRLVYAHRDAWEQAHGPISKGLTIDHLCREKLCVNVQHMEVVTRGENSRRRNLAVTHCPKGHAYTPENTRIQIKDGYRLRKCRECHRASERERHRRHRRRGPVAAAPDLGCRASRP